MRLQSMPRWSARVTKIDGNSVTVPPRHYIGGHAESIAKAEAEHYILQDDASVVTVELIDPLQRKYKVVVQVLMVPEFHAVEITGPTS